MKQLTLILFCLWFFSLVIFNTYLLTELHFTFLQTLGVNLLIVFCPIAINSIQSLFKNNKD